MGSSGNQLLGTLREAEWIHLIEALWALECKGLLGEVSTPDYRQQKDLLLTRCREGQRARGGRLAKYLDGEEGI